jgi:hypothetical protein
VKYSSSPPDKSYASKDDCQDPEVVEEEMGLLLGKGWTLLLDKC